MKAILKKHLLNALKNGSAHASFGKVLEKVPSHFRNVRVEGFPYSVWELLEHIRLAQNDILNYMVDPNYSPGLFPDDYWPKPGSRMHWDKTIREYSKDLEKIKKLVKDVDLLESIPCGKRGHTYLREILILVDHVSYHLGEIVLILRFNGWW